MVDEGTAHNTRSGLSQSMSLTAAVPSGVQCVRMEVHPSTPFLSLGSLGHQGTLESWMVPAPPSVQALSKPRVGPAQAAALQGPCGLPGVWVSCGFAGQDIVAGR